MQSVRDLLTEWDLERIIPVFEENEIDMEVFIHLNASEIESLFKNKVGLHNRFMRRYQEYKKNNMIEVNENAVGTSCAENIPIQEIPIEIISVDSLGNQEILDQISGSPNIQLSPAELEQVQTNAVSDMPLRILLKASVLGKIILGQCYHNRIQTLEEKDRQTLVEAIVYTLMNADPDKLIRFHVFDRLSNEIAELFPGESKCIYYIPGSGKNLLAKGKLVDKYHNTRAKCRAAKIISNKRKTAEEFLNVVNDSETLSPDLEQDLIWLKECTEPRSTVEEKWSATAEHRLQKLREVKLPPADSKRSRKIACQPKLLVADYLSMYPCLKQEWGYTLMYHALHAEYPPESRLMWIIIQKEVFDIHTEWDEDLPALHRLIADLAIPKLS